jgi:pteridine reductase
MFNLREKTALITGAAKRIGRSLAIELAKQGTNVVIHYNGSETEAHTLREDQSSWVLTHI